MQYGLKRLTKFEQAIQDRLKRKAKRYNKTCPSKLLHHDTKHFPLLQGQSANEPREYLFAAIDDFSRELYAEILPDKTQYNAARFLMDTVIAQCSYQIDYAYSDNGKEFKGTADHAFVKACTRNSVSVRSLPASIVLIPTVKPNRLFEL